MTRTEILNELKKLPAQDRLAIIEAAIHLLHQEIQHQEEKPNHVEKGRQMEAAAQALLQDYAQDNELTSFTALDAEDFHA